MPLLSVGGGRRTGRIIASGAIPEGEILIRGSCLTFDAILRSLPPGVKFGPVGGWPSRRTARSSVLPSVWHHLPQQIPRLPGLQPPAVKSHLAAGRSEDQFVW